MSEANNDQVYLVEQDEVEGHKDDICLLQIFPEEVKYIIYKKQNIA